jgi:hypothetical protein
MWRIESFVCLEFNDHCTAYNQVSLEFAHHMPSKSGLKRKLFLDT